jgi:hypothetical protein
MGEKRKAYRLLIGMPEGRRPLGSPRCELVDKMKMDLGEIRWGAWTGLFWLRIGTTGEFL